MPSKKIIKPKVFISYAWGNEEYQHKVLSFATKLMGDGIEVVLDKWDLKEGMDTFSFMEESVNNPKITNVLLLLDPVYAKKADNRDGGVGTETQIISTEVYRKVKQEKFIPVIFERNKRGNVCKPKYLVSRLHFDLSIAESFDSEYMRLVKTLYGVDSYVKPEIGNEPVWVEKPLITGLKNNVSYDFLKTHQPIQKKKESFMNYLNSIFNRIADFVQYNETEITADNYIDKYDSTEAIRNDYLLLLNQSVYIVGCYTEIADFFEKTENAICGNRTEAKNIIAIRIHVRNRSRLHSPVGLVGI